MMQNLPFAARATLAARERRIDLAEARAQASLANFELGGNRFQLFRSGGYADPELTALAVSHLGSIFEGLSLGFYFSQDNDRVTYLTAKASYYNVNHSRSLYAPLASGPTLFRLAVNLDREMMGLNDLASRVLGKGGEALLALYNIARGIGVETIVYAVHDHNEKAKLFYTRIGFGLPVTPRQTAWEVKIEK